MTEGGKEHLGGTGTVQFFHLVLVTWVCSLCKNSSKACSFPVCIFHFNENFKRRKSELSVASDSRF